MAKKLIGIVIFSIFLFLATNNNILAQQGTCGNVNQACCNNNALTPNSCNSQDLICTNGKCQLTGCGDLNQACCNNNPLTPNSCNNSNLTCSSGKCVSVQNPCGDIGQACCNNNPLTPNSCNNSSLICSNNVCVKSNCGDEGQQCCTNRLACNDSTLTCNSQNVCSKIFVPTSPPFSVACSNNPNGINTAIGCIPINDPNTLIGFILRWAIGIGGGIAFLLILVAGFQIMSSRGDPNQLKAGQELLTSAIAGLLFLIFSIIILKIIGVDILQLKGFGGS